MVAYILSAVISILYALKKLCRAKISLEVQRLVLLRHVLSIILFSIAQSYMLVGIIYMTVPYFQKYSTLDVENYWIYASKIAFEAQGIYLPILRWSEPYFFEVFLKNMNDLARFVFCCRRKRSNSIFIDKTSLLDRGLFSVEESLQDVSRVSEISKTEDIII